MLLFWPFPRMLAQKIQPHHCCGSKQKCKVGAKMRIFLRGSVSTGRVCYQPGLPLQALVARMKVPVAAKLSEVGNLSLLWPLASLQIHSCNIQKLNFVRSGLILYNNICSVFGSFPLSPPTAWAI